MRLTGCSATEILVRRLLWPEAKINGPGKEKLVRLKFTRVSRALNRRMEDDKVEDDLEQEAYTYLSEKRTVMHLWNCQDLLQL